MNVSNHTFSERIGAGGEGGGGNLKLNKNTCIEEPCELGKVARKMSWRDKDRVENCTIIFGIQFMMLWAPGEYKERQEIVSYKPSKAYF